MIPQYPSEVEDRRKENLATHARRRADPKPSYSLARVIVWTLFALGLLAILVRLW